jgi:GT2 family glycosyltransferase
MQPEDPHGRAGGEDRVTVVVATRDRRDELVRSLGRHEAGVIVVDNGSRDGTVAAVAALFPRVDLVAFDRNRGAPARNLGVERARTPYVAFADDDSWWAPGALARAADLLDAHPRLGLLAGRILVGPSQEPDPVCAQMEAAPLGREADLPGPSILGFLTCGAVVRRRAFLDAGGFDDVVFFYGEEERLALDMAAAGWGLAYAGDVVAHHHPSPSRDAFGRQALSVRNQLLTAMLRRPWRVVGRRVAAAARRDRASRAGLRAALPRAPRALVHRRPLPATVEQAARRVSGDEPAECRVRGSAPP